MYNCTLDSAISEAIIRSTACLRACFPSCYVHWISTLGASELSAFSLSSWIFTLPVSMEMHCLDSCVVFGFNRILPKRCRISTRYSLWVILWGAPPPTYVIPIICNQHSKDRSGGMELVLNTKLTASILRVRAFTCNL